MPCTITIYDTGRDLVVLFAAGRPARWYTITAINDGDTNGKLYGTELCLYEEPAIELVLVAHQFHTCAVVEVDNGLMYIYLREREKTFLRGFGFGRTAHVGIDALGHIHAVCIPWNEPGAATPIVVL